MRTPPPFRLPAGLRPLLLLLGGALAVLLTLVTYDASEAAPGPRRALSPAAYRSLPLVLARAEGGRAGFAAVRDTTDEDSLRRADSLRADPLRADSLAGPPGGRLPFGPDTLETDSLALGDTTEVLPDTGRAARLLPPFRRDAYAAPLDRRPPPLSGELG
ncbi:MAG: hypothetical protein R3362_10215, partial [Rhodothermales bacterium]|nr:hypothetical protein [Rhodothermales bacterium]